MFDSSPELSEDTPTRRLQFQTRIDNVFIVQGLNDRRNPRDANWAGVSGSRGRLKQTLQGT